MTVKWYVGSDMCTDVSLQAIQFRRRKAMLKCKDRVLIRCLLAERMENLVLLVELFLPPIKIQ